MRRPCRALGCLVRRSYKARRVQITLRSRWLQTVNREAPMISAGAVTKYEMDRGINIAADPLFFSWNHFHNLVTGKHWSYLFTASLRSLG